MICKNCGEQLDYNEKFCNNCGTEQLPNSVESEQSSERLDENHLIYDDINDEFEDDYNDYEPTGGSGFWYKFNELCYKINRAIQNPLESSVNNTNGKWILLFIAAVLNAASSGGFYNLNNQAQRTTSATSSLIGGIVLALIIWSIEKGIVKYVSRRINFGYGYRLEYKAERDTLVAFSVMLFALITLILSVLRLNSVPIIGMLLGPILNTIAITAVFYRQLRIKYAERFAKRFLVFHIILTLILFLILAGLMIFIFTRLLDYQGGINDIMHNMNLFENMIP